MDLEEKITTYRRLAKQIAEMSEARKSLGIQILEMLPKDADTYYSANCRVKRYKRFLIKTSIDEARKWGATKQDEVIDRKQIQKLYNSGKKIPDVAILESVIISDR